MFAFDPHIPDTLDSLRGESRDDEEHQVVKVLSLVAAPLLGKTLMHRRQKTRAKVNERGKDHVPLAERVLIAAARSSSGELWADTEFKYGSFTRAQREAMAMDRAIAVTLEDIFHITRNSHAAVVHQMRRRHDPRTVYVCDQISRLLARRFGWPFDELSADITNSVLGLDGKRAVTREVSRWCRKERLPPRSLADLERRIRKERLRWKEPADWMMAFASPARRVVTIAGDLV